MNMNRPQGFTTSQQPTFKLPAFQEDERLRFVDSVCATLMTSRFGDGAMYTLNRRFRGTADEPFDYLSLLEEEPVGWHERENHLRKWVARRDGQVVLINGNGASSASLGRVGPPLKPPADAGGSPSRGSPTFPGTSFFASSFAFLSELCVKIPDVSRNDRKRTQRRRKNPGTCCQNTCEQTRSLKTKSWEVKSDTQKERIPR